MSKPMILGGEGDLLERPLRELDSDELARLFLDAAKPQTQWYLGLELELFAYHHRDLTAVDHVALERVLNELGSRRRMEKTYEPSGALTGLKGDGQIVSLEPGGQLEFASRPHRSLKQLRREVLEYVNDLKRAAEDQAIGFWALGQQPFVDRTDSPKMPKPRYDMMRAYLGARGARGLDMMHLTGSIQCTVDFQSEQNLIDKTRTACRASPFLSALVAASPFTRGKPNGFKTVRYQIWLETDDERCGIWPEMVDDEGLSPRRYVERTLTAPPMFFIRDDEYVRAEPKPFNAYAQDGFRDTVVTVADYLDHLTTFFPEVRPKGYVELRGADCVEPVTAVAVAGFWRGILDDEATRRAVDERLAAMDYAAIRELQPRVARLGLEADSAAGPVGEVVEWLADAAYQRLSRSAPDCAECVLPLLERAQRRLSPADELLAEAEKSSVGEALRRVRV